METEKRVRVRPGTWVLIPMTDERSEQEVRTNFRERYRGCGYGCEKQMKGFLSMGLEEAAMIANICKDAEEEMEIKTGPGFEILEKRINHLSHKHHLNARGYLDELKDLYDVDIFEGLSNQVLLDEIRVYNERTADETSH